MKVKLQFIVVRYKKWIKDSLWDYVLQVGIRKLFNDRRDGQYILLS